MPLLMLKREKDHFNNALRDYYIFLDGKEAGTVGNDSEVKIEVDSGKHEISIGIDWCKTEPSKFEIKEGETCAFICGCNLKGYRWFFYPIFYIFFKPKEYLFLKKH